MPAVQNISINLSHVKEGLALEIIEKQRGTLFDEEKEAIIHNEARYQLVEGCFYDFDLTIAEYFLGTIEGNIVQTHRKLNYAGTIAPNIYVGTLFLPLFKKGIDEPVFRIPLEVRSRKSNYRDDYRDMLEYITEKCTDLLLQINSPVYQNFEPDFTKDISPDVLYQRFIFLKSIIGTNEFSEAVHRIVTNPVTTWKEEVKFKDVRNLRRFSRGSIKELVKGNNRNELPKSHYLTKNGLESIPAKIQSVRKIDSLDTPENRFIKYALETFLKFCVEIHAKAKKLNKGNLLVKESASLIYDLENQLHHTVFSEISKPYSLKLNSPVLQRKEGYREVLRVWLMFDLAAKLIWKGGEDVYQGGKKDIATLYEYWLFFKLLELLQSIFKIEPKDIENLISLSDNGLNVNLRQGKFTALKGVYNSGSRKFNIQFNYNRSFTGKKDYPNSGSWTTTLRPDYTLSIWPFGISDSKAEEEELIVHIHFDAKYKVDNFIQITDQEIESDLNEEKSENRKGYYKNADLIKMHAYKDAIRRTGGAYVLYPGSEKIERKGFHEIIPGLGAFPVKPSKTADGTEELKSFIIKVIHHFINRASQREKIAFKSYDVYQNPPKDEDKVNEFLPETYGVNRDLIPDETFVLVGYSRSPKRMAWYEKHKLYNFRIDDDAGSLVLDKELAGAKYLLLRENGMDKAERLFRITSKGPKVYSMSQLQKLGYPKMGSGKEYYLVIEIERVKPTDFGSVNWKFKDLPAFQKIITGESNLRKRVGIPFTVTLSELMRVVEKNE